MCTHSQKAECFASITFSASSVYMTGVGWTSSGPSSNYNGVGTSPTFLMYNTPVTVPVPLVFYYIITTPGRYQTSWF